MQRRWAPGRRGVDPLPAETPGRGRGIPEGIPEFKCVPALGPRARALASAQRVGESLSPYTPAPPRHLSPGSGRRNPGADDGAARRADPGAPSSEIDPSLRNLNLPAPGSGKPRPGSTWPPRAVGGVAGFREPGVPGAPPPTPRDCWDAGPGGPSGGGRLSPARPGSSGLSPARVLGFFIWAPTAAFTWSANLLPSSPPGEFRALSGPVVQAEIPRPRDVK